MRDLQHRLQLPVQKQASGCSQITTDVEIRIVAAYKFWGACGGKLQCVVENMILLKIHSTAEMTLTKPYNSIATIFYLQVTHLASLSSKLGT